MFGTDFADTAIGQIVPLALSLAAGVMLLRVAAIDYGRIRPWLLGAGLSLIALSGTYLADLLEADKANVIEARRSFGIILFFSIYMIGLRRHDHIDHQAYRIKSVMLDDEREGEE